MSISWDPKNKRWRFWFDRYIAGERNRSSKLLPRGWSRAQADAFDGKETARLYAVATGVGRVDPLIDEAISRYLHDKRGLKSFRSTAEHLAAIAWAYVGRPMSTLPAIAAEVIKHESERGIAPATIRQRLALLKAAARWAWKRHGLTEHDPTGRMILPTVRNERQVYFDRRGMLALAWASRSHPVKILIRVSFYSGMRLGEIGAVAIDAERELFLLTDTKNGDVRAIPIHPKLRTCLPYLPLAMPRSTLHKYLSAARAATGLEGTTFHTTRHSAASEMLDNDVDLYTVGAILGHRDPRSTKRYGHLAAGRLAGAVGKIGRKVPHHNRVPARRKAA